jgi:AhpD family alkylhydroperoxidase
MRVHVTPEQIRAAFDAVKDDPSFEESRALGERGRPPAQMIQAMCLRPELLRAFAGFGDCVYPGGLLERSVKELVILTSSRRNACQFCLSSHVDLARMLGIADDPVKALDDTAARTPRERLAIEYTHAAMTDSNRIPEDLYARLHASFSDPELVELTFLVGFIQMLNLFNNALGVRYESDYAALAPR